MITKCGSPNFRDLGGYAAAGGRRVKRGLVFRSDDLSDLNRQGRSVLADLGLKTVIDFRARDEAADFPDRLPPTVKNIRPVPIEAGRLMRALFDGRPAHRKSMGIMVSVYRALVNDFQDAYREFFRVLSVKDNTPLLFHCTAGKDRTGLAAALFLSALGVDRETVFADYLLSRECLQGKYHAGVDYDAEMEPLYSVSPEFLKAALEAIDGQFGGMERFLDERLGVNRPQLREIYTEQT